MQNTETHAEHFFCFQQMTDVGSAVMTARRALAAFLNRTRIQLVFLIEQVHFSMVCVNVAVTSVPARVYAVEEIDAALYALENICRRSNAHQIRRFVFRQVRNHFVKNMIHLLMAFSYCQSADRITVEIHLGNPFCMVNADILINRTLVDSEQKLMFVDRVFPLVQLLHLIFASLQPSRRAVDRVLHITALCHTRRALVESHRDG